MCLFVCLLVMQCSLLSVMVMEHSRLSAGRLCSLLRGGMCVFIYLPAYIHQEVYLFALSLSVVAAVMMLMA